jgi:rhamnulose-1-phosphate aldolase/alcohol dehydrogenase
MVAMYTHTTFNLNPRASSIDTPLHSFIPAKFVDHMHPNAIIAIAASQNCEKLTQEIFGGEMAYVKWMRPGFELGLAMQEIVRENPTVKSIMMGQHGFISWADDEKACYTYTLDCIEKAAAYIEAKYAGQGRRRRGVRRREVPDPRGHEAARGTLAAILPWLRGQVSQQKRFIGTVQDDAKILRFVNSKDAPRLAELGTSCPDHFLRTKIKPLYVDWNPQAEDAADLKAKLAAGLEAYRKDYAAYYARCKHANSPAMRDPNPTVVLIPGLGMIAWGKDKSESRVTAEFYNCAVEVMRGAEAIDRYIALPQQEAFDIEYWLLEEAKLKRMPAEKELARQVVVVIGAGSGIGKETAHRLVKEGAHWCALISTRRGAGDGEGDHRPSRRRYRRGGYGPLGLRPGARTGGEHHRSRQHAADVGPGGARLRRVRFDLRDGGHFRAERHHRAHSRRQVGAHLRDQRHRQLHCRRRGDQDLARAGPARQPRAHHLRQRDRGEEGLDRLRLFEGGRQSPCPAKWPSNLRRSCA